MRALYGKWTEGLYSCPVNVWDEYQAGNLSSNPNPVSNDGPTSEFHTPANGSSFEDANDVKFNFTDNDSASTLPASLEYDGKTVEKSDSKALLVGNATAVTETRTGNGSAMKTSASAPAGVGNPPDKISKDKTDLADKLKALCVMDNESSDEDGEEEFEVSCERRRSCKSRGYKGQGYAGSILCEFERAKARKMILMRFSNIYKLL